MHRDKAQESVSLMRRRSSMAEQLHCQQQTECSNPPAGSSLNRVHHIGRSG